MDKENLKDTIERMFERIHAEHDPFYREYRDLIYKAAQNNFAAHLAVSHAKQDAIDHHEDVKRIETIGEVICAITEENRDALQEALTSPVHGAAIKVVDDPRQFRPDMLKKLLQAHKPIDGAEGKWVARRALYNHKPQDRPAAPQKHPRVKAALPKSLSLN